MLLCRSKLLRSHLDIAHPFQLLHHQSRAGIHILRVATKIGAENTGIRIGSQIGLYIIDKATALAQSNIQTAVHSGTAQNIIQQIKSRALIIVSIVTATAYHDVSLMRIFRHNKPFGGIEGRWSATVIHRYRRYIGKKFLSPTDDLPEVQISPNKENHIPGMIEAGGKSRSIFAAKGFQQFGITQNITPQRMPAEYQILEIIKNKLGRSIFVRLNFVNNHFRFLFNFTLRKSGVKYNIRQ